VNVRRNWGVLVLLLLIAHHKGMDNIPFIFPCRVSAGKSRVDHFFPTPLINWSNLSNRLALTSSSHPQGILWVRHQRIFPFASTPFVEIAEIDDFEDPTAFAPTSRRNNSLLGVKAHGAH
jgi:hypothetical protein